MIRSTITEQNLIDLRYRERLLAFIPLLSEGERELWYEVYDQIMARLAEVPR